MFLPYIENKQLIKITIWCLINCIVVVVESLKNRIHVLSNFYYKSVDINLYNKKKKKLYKSL